MAEPIDTEPPSRTPQKGGEDGAAPYVPRSRSIRVLAAAAQGCRGCALYANATQAVFGEGPARASLMLVGEQPGDQEDRRGHPFVGPAGRVLWKCVDEAGLDRDGIFMTNVVKHFKHEDRGKRRIHKRPTTAEVEACTPWLEAELRAVQAPVVLALGATAARGVLGKTVQIARCRATPLPVGDRTVFVTYHPSAILRADEAAAELRAALIDDLRRAGAAAGIC
jgi:uracil-DNA glycosylase family protein